MNRKEYLDKLAEQLNFLPEETRNAALSFYGEMVDDRMEDGMDELSAVAAMASPEAIAARLRAENPAEEDKPDEKKAEAPADATDKKWQEEPLEDDALRFSGMADKVFRSISEAMDNAQAVTPEVKKDVEEAAQEMEEALKEVWNATSEAAKELHKQAKEMEGAFSGIGDEDEVPPESVGEYTRKIFSCPVDALRAVRLTAVDKPVRIKPCAGKEATLIYYTSERDPYEAGLENGVLSLANQGNGKGRGGFTFFSIGLNFRINWSKGSPKIYLLMPSDALVDLTVKTSNGSIRMEGFSALCAINLTTSNSRIDLKQVHCKSLEMKTSNARLNLEGVESKQCFRGATSNGRIEGSGLVSGQKMTLETSNGRIHMEGAQACAGMRLDTSNGSIAVSGLKADALELRTSNSSIRGTLPGRQSDWAIQSSTSNGHNSLPRSQMGGKPLSVRTSNGSIDLKFED